MKVTATIEKTQYGYDIHMTDKHLDFMLLGQGDSVKEAMEDFYICRDEFKEMYEDEQKDFPVLEFTFKYDLSSFLEYYTTYFSYASLERLTGVNQAQLSQYVQGYRKPSKKTAEKIQQKIHQFAEELHQVQFV